MNLRETYNKNKKKHLLKEVTATSATTTFVGGAGDVIDQKFAGPFHPEFGNLKKELENQIDNDIAIRMWTDDITPLPDQDFIDLDWKYEYDEYIEKDNSKFINKSGIDWEYVDLDIKYDTIIDKTKENEKYFNSKDKKWKTNIDYEYDNDVNIDKSKFKSISETDMQLVDIDIKYDEVIDKTEENKKFMNDTSGWKSIYDDKKY